MAKNDKKAVTLDEDDDVENIISFEEDVSEVEKPEPIPEGDYAAVITEAVPHVSQSSGKKSAKLTFRISPEDYPADYPVDEAPDGTKLTHYASLAEGRQQRYRLRVLCETLGVPIGTSLNLSDMIGKSAILTVQHEEYEGEPQARIRRINEA